MTPYEPACWANRHSPKAQCRCSHSSNIDLDGLTVDEACDRLRKVEKDIMEAHPSAHRIKLLVETVNSYDNSCTVCTQLEYSRAETDYEIAERLRNSKQMDRQAEERERAQYDLLRKKFEA